MELNLSSYLGLQWETTPEGKTKIHNDKYIREAIDQIEKRLGIIIKKENVPYNKKLYPEEDDLAILDPSQITEYQRLIGVLQWIQSSLRMDISLDVSSLARFQVQP